MERIRNDKEIMNRRDFTKLYYLSIGTENIKVCQIMFIKTLYVTIKEVRNIVKKKNINQCWDVQS